MRRFRRFTATVALVASLAMVSSGVAHAEPAHEHDFVWMINEARMSAGLAPLATSQSLTDVARGHSGTMAAEGRIWHNTNLPNQLSGQGWRALGENVGAGGTVGELHRAFMQSESHRVNILGDYDKVGVGVVTAGSTIFVTEVFAKSGSVAPVPVAKASKSKVSCKKVRGKKVCRRVKSKARSARR